jgi:hypothetical protein
MLAIGVIVWIEEAGQYGVGYCGTPDALEYCQAMPAQFALIYSSIILGLVMVVLGLGLTYQYARAEDFTESPSRLG